MNVRGKCEIILKIVKYLSLILFLILSLELNCLAADKSNSYPLHRAAKLGDFNSIQSLIEKGHDVNSRDENGQNPLHWLVNHPRWEEQESEWHLLVDPDHKPTNEDYISAAELLLSLGVNVNAKDKLDETTPLHLAVQRGYSDLVAILIQHGANVNDRTKSHGNTPLHSCARYSYNFWIPSDNIDQISALLITSGADINAMNYSFFAPLHLFAAKGSMNVVKLLIENGAEIDICSKYHGDYATGGTPLALSVLSNQKDVAKFLISHGADINTICFDNYPIFESAAVNGNLDMVTYLLDEGAEITHRPYLHYPYILSECVRNCSSDSVEIARILIEKGIEVNVGDFIDSPLHISSKHGCFDMVAFLLSKGANVNPKNKVDKTPLDLALENNHKNVAELLLEMGGKRGSEIPYSAETLPFWRAIVKGEIGVVREHIKRGVNVNEIDDNYGSRPILIAVTANELDAVKELITHGADVNVIDYKKRTPLLLALENENFDLSEILKDSNADLNHMSHQSPLHLSLEKGNPRIAKKLINKGADVNLITVYGESPLHIASGSGLVEIVETLLSRNVEINVVDRIGNTPLHKAVLRGRSDVVEVLVKNGADVSIENKDGDTPLDLARRHKVIKIEEFLKSAELVTTE